MNVRYRSFRWVLIGLWSALLGSTLVYASALRAQAAPTLTIVAPADGSSVDRPVTIRVEHNGIRFDGVKVGGTNEPGVGHWHVYVDDKFAGLSPTNVIELPNDAYPTISAGRHRITATLNENNHAPLNPPVSQTIELNFTKEVSIPVSQTGQPSLTVVFPTANATIDAPFVARVEHSGFKMDGVGSGSDPVPGTGHWHINIDGRYAGMSVSNVLELPNDSFPRITAGQHTLTFYVHQNNHVATNPPVAASIRINVTQDITLPMPGQQGTGATPTTGAAQPTTSGATPTTGATQARATPTTGATATAQATASAQATVTAATTASVEPSATIGLPGIPNTGNVPVNATLPGTLAITFLVLGAVLLYMSQFGSFQTATATAGGGRQIDLSLGKLLRQPIVIRINVSAAQIARARTAMSFAGGASVGLSISAMLLVLHGTTTTPTLVGNAPHTGPVITAPLPMAPAFVQAPEAAREHANTPDLSGVAVVPAPAPITSQPFGPQVAALPWPSKLPAGMEFAAEDSWPFRLIDTHRANEPFLVFRDDDRWMLLRYGANDAPTIGTPLEVAGVQGTMWTNADGTFQASWRQDGRTVQMSGVGLTADDITVLAQGLEAQTATQLRAQLAREASHRQLNITLLWPQYMPAGLNLAASESTVELSLPGTIPNADRYRLVFRGGESVVEVGGGTQDVPTLAGTTEHFEVDGLKGRMTVGDRQFLLVLDSGNADEATLRFAPVRDDQGRLLPLVQQGKVYVAAQNLDQAQFERIVAGLSALGAPEFQAQARGQSYSSVPYLWPSRLPEGFTVDLGSVRYARPDDLLQGSYAYFVMTAVGPEGKTLTIKGGREADGTAFIVPEGQDIEQIMTEVHGRGATAARNGTTNILVWSEGTVSYMISSETVELEQLLAVAQGLTRIDEATWTTWSANGADKVPGVTIPKPLERNDGTTIFTLDDVPDISAMVAASVKGDVEPQAVAVSAEAAPQAQQIATLPAAPDRLVIPAIDLDTPVFGVDNAVPKHDVGWYKHSGRPSQGTNIVMWGHVLRWKDSPNIPAPFEDVHTLGVGDVLYVVSATGERFKYAITRQLRVTPDKVKYLAPTDFEQLLLVSCIGDKIIVNGELTKSERLLTFAEPVE